MIFAFPVIVLLMGFLISFTKLIGFPGSAAFILLTPFFIFPFTQKKISIQEVTILFVILIFLLRYISGDQTSWEGLKQSIFCLVCLSVLKRCYDKDLIQISKIILLISCFLSFTGLFQLIGIEPFTSIKPLPNSDFVGSGGFSSISISRSNFGLGNSINIGTFYVLCMFLLLYTWDIHNRWYRIVLMILFITSVFLTLSRSAVLGLIIISPLIYKKINKKTFISLIIFFTVVAYEWILLIFKRFFDSDYRVGSDDARYEIFTNFLSSFEYHNLFIGIANVNESVFIPDGLFLYNILNLGLIVTIIFTLILIYPFRFNKNDALNYFTLVILFCVFSIINNSFHAFYNILLFLVNIRLVSCIKNSQFFSQSTMEKSI